MGCPAAPRTAATGHGCDGTICEGVLMASSTHTLTFPEPTSLRALANDLPILYEDEAEGDMGETSQHVDSDKILHICLEAHLAARPELRVFSNMNLYYRDEPLHPRTKSRPYVSPDTMVVKPYKALPRDVSSYTVGRDGPAPILTAEILSARSAQQRDRREKVTLYAGLNVPEYVLVDATGRFLPERLLLKRLQPDGAWKDERDPDGGVTSQLGFRLIIDTDGRLRMINAVTGQRYARPDEAQAAADAAQATAAELAIAQERILALQEELARIRRAAAKAEPKAKNGKGRRRKP